MNLKHLTDDCLIAETRRHVQHERDLLTTILHHFREMERRRLFCKHGSLHACAVKEFGYSDDQAHRRVTAMRLINELPELEEQIEAGQINLSHVGVAHSLFKNEQKLGKPMTTDQKLEVFEAIAGQSIRQAQGIANSFATEKMRHKDFVKSLRDGRNLFTGELTDAVLEKLQAIRGLLAHQKPDATFNDLIDQAPGSRASNNSIRRSPARANQNLSPRPRSVARSGCAMAMPAPAAGRPLRCRRTTSSRNRWAVNTRSKI